MKADAQENGEDGSEFEKKESSFVDMLNSNVHLPSSSMFFSKFDLGNDLDDDFLFGNFEMLDELELNGEESEMEKKEEEN